MSYFSALGRQSGVRIGGQPAVTAVAATRKPIGIEVEETRIAAPPPARAADTPRSPVPRPSAAPEPARPAAPLRAADPDRVPALPSRAPEAARTPLIPAARVDAPAPEAAPPLIREVVVEVESPSPRSLLAAAPDEVFVPYIAASAEPAEQVETPPPAPPPRPEKPAPPERRNLPTLADVRKWVAKPLLEAAREDLFEPAASPGAALTAPGAAPPPAVRPEQPESLTLEIGSINITFDTPPASVVPATPPQARSSGPRIPAPAEGRASRYYIRI